MTDSETDEDGQLLDQSSPHQLEPVRNKVKSMPVFCRELLTFVIARWHCGSMEIKTAFKVPGLIFIPSFCL